LGLEFSFENGFTEDGFGGFPAFVDLWES